MIKYNKTIIELLQILEEETELYNKKVSSFSKIDFLILKKIVEILKTTKKYIFNYPNEDYIDANLIKTFNAKDMKENISFECMIKYHEIFSGHIEYSLDIPTIIIMIKKDDPALRELSKIIGTSFYGDFIYYFRKIDNKWYIPCKGTYFNKELKILETIDVFKNQSINYDIKYDNKELRDNSQTFKRYLYKLYLEATNILDNENFESFLIDSDNQYYTSNAFLKSEPRLNYDQKINRHKIEVINRGVLDDIAKTGLSIS